MSRAPVPINVEDHDDDDDDDDDDNNTPKFKFILGSEACSHKTRVSTTCASGILLFYFLKPKNQVWIICILIYQNLASQM